MIAFPKIASSNETLKTVHFYNSIYTAFSQNKVKSRCPSQTAAFLLGLLLCPLWKNLGICHPLLPEDSAGGRATAHAQHRDHQGPNGQELPESKSRVCTPGPTTFLSLYFLQNL